MRLVLPLAQHEVSNLDATVNRQQKPLSKAGCEQARFLSGGNKGKQWACGPKLGHSPGPQNQQLNKQVNDRAAILFGR